MGSGGLGARVREAAGSPVETRTGRAVGAAERAHH